VIVSLACNDPDNGIFMGHADHATFHYEGVDLSLYHLDWYRGCRVTYVKEGGIRISRRVFKYRREKEWYGNWCWNAFLFDRLEARRLLRYLRDSGRWHAEEGPSRLFRWFNREEKDG
jgi:hypothetical protein